ncbi:ATPase [Aphanothece sacrum]|uniref:ATPase n=1 Tax=Aphanothece sacrum FPU1 TaxID=1920663 RepID=A0A401IHZ1_APHSA|nr:ATPase [Aphanothece sacrum]GBF80922.1 ATPase [Aphanothece sacrum FPU1]GBF85229.1 ATPase [Aphanothece sacrum FPU3]
MDTFDVRSLIVTVDDLIFSHRGEHLDDIEQAILKGVFDHEKYAEIAKHTKRSEKYIKYVAGRLWQSLSSTLGEEVSKSNVKSSLQRYYSNFSHSNIINSIKINKGNICTGLSENELKQSNPEQQAKIEIATELMKEGLSIEQIARVLKLPLELVKEQIQK